MENYEIDDILYRVIDGYIDFEDRKIYDPTNQVKIRGKKIYVQTLRSTFDLLSDRDLLIFLNRIGQWSSEIQAEYDRMPKLIEDQKLTYYKYHVDPIKRKQNRTVLENTVDRYNKLSAKRNSFYHFTSHGIAVGRMWRSMIEEMYDGNDYLNALSYYHKNKIDNDDIRDVALSSEWIAYFSVNENVFGSNPFNLTDYQRDLIHWSKIYSNVRSHPECPEEPIFNDHFAFDGWMIKQNRDRVNEKKKDNLSTGKIQNPRNFYAFGPRNSDEIKEIYDLNDDKAKAKISETFKQIKEEGTVKDHHLRSNTLKMFN